MGGIIEVLGGDDWEGAAPVFRMIMEFVRDEACVSSDIKEIADFGLVSSAKYVDFGDIPPKEMSVLAGELSRMREEVAERVGRWREPSAEWEGRAEEQLGELIRLLRYVYTGPAPPGTAQ